MSSDFTSVIDLLVLQQFLTDNGVVVAGPLKVDLISGGKSNLTFAATDGTTRWVVRRPPTSGLTPSAHDMNREWQVTRALQDTPVPVARTVAFDADGSVFGAPTTIVEFVDGQVIRTIEDIDGLTDAQIEGNVDALVSTLVALHNVDYASVGLSEFGRPDGFLARQVKLWARQWGIVKTRELPDIDKLIAALSERVPPMSRTGIVHGDFRVDNTIVAADDPGTVRAVVDWELSTLGDTITDVALMCVYRRPVFDTVLGFSAAWTSDRYPSADELASRYVDKSGVDLGDWPFYLGLANLKLGVIAEGIAHRALAGASDSANARAAEGTAEFIAEGLRQVS